MAIVGAFCLSVIVAYAVFLACFWLLDHLHLWSDAGFAAFIEIAEAQAFIRGEKA